MDLFEAKKIAIDYYENARKKMHIHYEPCPCHIAVAAHSGEAMAVSVGTRINNAHLFILETRDGYTHCTLMEASEEKDTDPVNEERENGATWDACENFAAALLKSKPGNEEMETLKGYFRQVKSKSDMINALLYASKLTPLDTIKELVTLVAGKEETFDFEYLATLCNFHLAV